MAIGNSKHNADSGGKIDQPEWTDGLKQLYDSVVDEPLPDTFKDLLAKLDDSDTAGPDHPGGDQ
ncbi:MAG: NepR family anti-sigma factor [Pseudomonadota bacterium]